MESKFKFLNEYFNEYCKTFSDSFYLKNLDNMFYLSNDLYFMLEKLDNINDIDYKKDSFIYMSGVESIDIVREFIKDKCPIYLETFNEYLTNGVFEFIDDENKELPGNYAGISEGHRYITMDLTHTYYDPAMIVHEFIHHMNLDDDNKYTNTRETLTEAISIYFETLVYNYMEEKGYNKKEVSKFRAERIKDCFFVSDILGQNAILLDSYLKFGKLDKDTVEERNKYNLPNWVDTLNYYKSVNNLCRELAYQPSIFIEYEARYLYGPIIAISLLEKNTDIEKIKELNNKVKTESVEDCLKYVDIDIKNDITNYKLLRKMEKYAHKVNNNLSKKEEKSK